MLAVDNVKSVKYLYEYVYKGYDAATITVEDNNVETSNDKTISHDEIKNFYRDMVC